MVVKSFIVQAPEQSQEMSISQSNLKLQIEVRDKN